VQRITVASSQAHFQFRVNGIQEQSLLAETIPFFCVVDLPESRGFAPTRETANSVLEPKKTGILVRPWVRPQEERALSLALTNETFQPIGSLHHP
jgi:hypothetical protein